jgi:ketosteroid isomerase-like protein
MAVFANPNSRVQEQTMNRKVIYSLLGILSLGAAGALQAQTAMGETEKAVAAQERQWLQSQKTNNADLLVPLLAEKFVNTGEDGKVTNKAQTLAAAKASHWISAEYENLEVVVYGDAAIATGLFVGKGTDSKGKPMDEQERFTDTWVKMPGGKWQCVASHGSTIKK